MSNYFYYNDFPLTIAKGGKENQLKNIVLFSKQCFNNSYEINDKNSPLITSNDILHFFGDTPHFFYTINYLNGSGIYPKTIVNPNFFRRNFRHYKLLRLIPKVIPNWYSERLQLYKKVDLIITNSNYERLYLSKIFGKWIKKKTVVIYNTFDTGNLDSSDNFQEFNFKFYLSVTHISERKNIFELIKSSDLIFKKYGFYLVLIGGLRFHNPNNIKRFNDEIQKRDHIKYLGIKTKNEIDIYYKSCQFHILPSYIETPGISNLEASFYKKPIVVGNFPVLREYFSENATYTNFGYKSIFKSVSELVRSGLKKNNTDLSFCSKKAIEAEYIKQFLRLKNDI